MTEILSVDFVNSVLPNIHSMGVFFNVYAPGYNPLVSDVYGGWAIRHNTVGSWFTEVGAGGSFSVAFGAGVAGHFALGRYVGKSWFIFLPFMFKTGGTPGFTYYPHVGLIF